MDEASEYYPDQAGTIDDDYSLVIAFNIPEQHLAIDFHAGKSPDDQDKKLGMDTIYVGRSDLGIGHYNGIKRLELLQDDTLLVELLTNISKDLMIANDFRIPFGHLQNHSEINLDISRLLTFAPLNKP